MLFAVDRRLTLTTVALLVIAIWTGREACTPELYALDLAGFWSTNCGTVGPRDDHVPSIECLLKAQAEDHAARVMFIRSGIDSAVADVFVRTGDGTSLLLGYDSDGSGGGGLSPKLWQKKCARFERVIRERAFDIGPDLDCVDASNLPPLCRPSLGPED